jgi:hypothetical protein
MFALASPDVPVEQHSSNNFLGSFLHQCDSMFLRNNVFQQLPELQASWLNAEIKLSCCWRYSIFYVHSADTWTNHSLTLKNKINCSAFYWLNPTSLLRSVVGLSPHLIPSNAAPKATLYSLCCHVSPERKRASRREWLPLAASPGGRRGHATLFGNCFETLRNKIPKCIECFKTSIESGHTLIH